MASNRLWRDRKERIVIMDTSAVLMLFEYAINLEDELDRLVGKNRIVIPQPVHDELEWLSQCGKGKQQFVAKPALVLIQKYDIIGDDYSKNADEAIIQVAQDLQGIVVTNDRELRKRLKKKSLPVVYLRGKKTLVLE